MNKTTFNIALLILSSYSYFSQAQNFEKAFKEGDKIIGLNTNIGWDRYSGFPKGFGINYDQAIKGTNGILSIGGFAYYKRQIIPGYKADTTIGNIIYGSQDYSIKNKIENYGLGISIAAHYAVKRWDFYGGLRIGVDNQRYNFYDTYTNRIVKGSNFEPMIIPYSGARYYMNKSVSLQLEYDYKRPLSFGFSKKF
jgi:hypothetical protein